MHEQELIEEIDGEIENLRRLKDEMSSFIADIVEEPTSKEIRVFSSILHDFYSGIEKVFEKIALFLDGDLPKGETWHIDLLRQMSKSSHNRPAVISESLFERLKEYLRFRHLLRHIYGFKIKWESVKPLALSMSSVLDEFEDNLNGFMEFLRSRRENDS